MSENDYRLQKIHAWLEKDLNLNPFKIEPASSDASFRRYFRVFYNHEKQIVMDAPPTHEDIKPFLHVAELMHHSGVNVPEIFRQNLRDGFLLLEDFGSCCYLDILNDDNVDVLYQSAMDSILKLQHNTDIINSNLPEYDFDLLNTELQLFREWFLKNLLCIDLSRQEHNIIDNAWDILIQSALEQPKVCVHRDYHSRNLMYLEENNPGIIDFQDAVIGPLTYDLVSLLRDCYIAWPEAQITGWLKKYHSRLEQMELSDCSFQQFKQWFDLMGIQRHLKAIGIFSRLQLRDNKPEYLKDIPRTMNYVTNICNLYPELKEFGQFLQERVLPVERLLQ